MAGQVIPWSPPPSMRISAEQWGSMSASQQKTWLQATGFYEAAAAAQNSGDEIQFQLSPSEASSGSQAPQGKGGGAKGIGGLAGTAALDYGVKQGYNALFPGAGAAAAADTAAGAGAAASTALAPGGAAGTFGATVPVATDAATGGTILADGSVVGGQAGSTMASIAPWLGGAAALYGGYNLAKGFGQGGVQGRKQGAMNGMTTGAGIGTMILPGVGTAIGAGAGLVGGALLGSIKTGKSKDQMSRDQIRKIMLEKELVDKDYMMKFQDGTSFDVGKDGGYRDKDGRRNFELSVTPDNLQHTTVGWAGPVAALLAMGGSDTQRHQTTGMLAKGAMQSGDLENSRKNILGVFQKMGITQDQANQAFDQMDLTPEEKNAYKAGLGTLISGKYFTDELERWKKAQGATQPTPAPTAGTPAAQPQGGILGSLIKGKGAIQTLPLTLAPGQLSSPAITQGVTGVQRVPATVVPPAAPPRSQTSSPGFDKNGRRLANPAVNRRLLAA